MLFFCVFCFVQILWFVELLIFLFLFSPLQRIIIIFYSPFALYWMAIYGQLKLLPDSSISLIRVSMGVLPTKRTKNNCSMTEEETVRREGRRNNSFPKRVGWFGYWLRTYSSRAHWDFSCKLSTCAMSDRPHASRRNSKKRRIVGRESSTVLKKTRFSFTNGHTDPSWSHPASLLNLLQCQVAILQGALPV